MGHMKNIFEGLKVIEEHTPSCGFVAEKGQIWTGTPGLMSVEEKAYMVELGWHEDRRVWSYIL